MLEPHLVFDVSINLQVCFFDYLFRSLFINIINFYVYGTSCLTIKCFLVLSTKLNFITKITILNDSDTALIFTLKNRQSYWLSEIYYLTVINWCGRGDSNPWTPARQDLKSCAFDRLGYSRDSAEITNPS